MGCAQGAGRGALRRPSLLENAVITPLKATGSFLERAASGTLSGVGELLEWTTASPRSSFKHDPAAGPQLPQLTLKAAPAVTAPPLTEEVTSEQQATEEITSEQQPPTEEITSLQRAPSKLEVAAVLEEDSTQVEP